AGGLRESPPQRRAFSAILRLKKNPHVAQLNRIAAILCRRVRFAGRAAFGPLLQDLPRSIRRTIVHHDDFLAPLGLLRPPQDLIDGSLLVVSRNDHRQLGIDQGGRIASLARHKKYAIVAVRRSASKAVANLSARFLAERKNRGFTAPGQRLLVTQR